MLWLFLDDLQGLRRALFEFKEQSVAVGSEKYMRITTY